MSGECSATRWQISSKPSSLSRGKLRHDGSTFGVVTGPALATRGSIVEQRFAPGHRTSGRRPFESVIALPLTSYEPQDLHVVPGGQDTPDPLRDRVGSGRW